MAANTANRLNLGETFRPELSSALRLAERLRETCQPTQVGISEADETRVCAAGVSVIIRGKDQGGSAGTVCANADMCPNSLPAQIN